MKNILSIIIVTYNSQAVVEDCLQSLQTHYKNEISSKSYEIIVVDNHSTDKTLDLISKKFRYVKIHSNKENIGFSKANNQGISIANGKYILLLNPDTILTKYSLSELIQFMDTNPTVGIITCKVLLANGNLDDACHRGFPTPWRAITHFTGLGNIFPNSLLFNGYHLGYQNLDKIHEIEACAGAFMFIRRKTGESAGWLDEDYFWYGEDLDFCYKVWKSGFKIIFYPQISIIHHKGASSGFKKHSRHLSNIDLVNSQKIIRSRFDVMRIFYKKHYQNIYPEWLTQLVFMGIWVKEKFTNFKI